MSSSHARRRNVGRAYKDYPQEGNHDKARTDDTHPPPPMSGATWRRAASRLSGDRDRGPRKSSGDDPLLRESRPGNECSMLIALLLAPGVAARALGGCPHSNPSVRPVTPPHRANTTDIPAQDPTAAAAPGAKKNSATALFTSYLRGHIGQPTTTTRGMVVAAATPPSATCPSNRLNRPTSLAVDTDESLFLFL